jgi:hypothetical protein
MEALDKQREALGEFQHVFISSPNFRDVSERVRVLKEQLRRKARPAVPSG